MTSEELLKPRYKLIADFPTNRARLGFIYTAGQNAIEYFEQYPAIFKKLEWWEERNIEDMPEYVRNGFDGKIHKTQKWLSDKKGELYFLENDELGWYAHAILPTISTQEEYENQNNKP